MIYSLTISLICFLAFALIAFCDFTLPNRLLRNTHFRSFSVKDWLQCVEACHAEPSCVSYNYDASNLNMCQLNNCAFRDRCEAFRNLLASPNAIFHQLKPVTDEALCAFPAQESVYPVFIGRPTASRVPVSKPTVCQTDKNTSHEQSLHSVTICGQRNHNLYDCSKNKIRLITVRYSKCTCKCDSCKTMALPEACVPRKEFNWISKKCEGRIRCKVKRKDDPCNSSSKMAIHITYSCGTLNMKNSEREDDNDDDQESSDDNNPNGDHKGSKQDGYHGDHHNQHGRGRDEEHDENHSGQRS